MTGTYIPAIYAKIEEFLTKRVLSSNDGFAPVSNVGQAISEMQLCLDLNKIEERNAK